MILEIAGLILATIIGAAPAYAQDQAPEPAEYRTENYRAPVPATLAGALSEPSVSLLAQPSWAIIT